MRINSQNQTIKKNYIQKYRFFIREYQEVKAGVHTRYRHVQDFYEAHDLDRRTFRKYYSRYLQSGREEDLLPRKRGPRRKTRRILPEKSRKPKCLSNPISKAGLTRSGRAVENDMRGT
jgi:hypothetical protein